MKGRRAKLFDVFGLLFAEVRFVGQNPKRAVQKEKKLRIVP